MRIEIKLSADDLEQIIREHLSAREDIEVPDTAMIKCDANGDFEIGWDT